MSENLYAPNCIRTYTGKYVNVLNPTADMIDIEDIAHSLSMQCRFAGHLAYKYSIAQHSISCAELVENFKLEALLHDASEAYLLDIPSPIKSLIPQYKTMEKRFTKLIFNKFGALYPIPQYVHDVDRHSLECEWHNLMLGKYNMSEDFNKSKDDFLTMFHQLKKRG